MIEIITKYWIQWVCGIIAAGVLLWAKHVIKLEKESISSAKAKQSKELREEILHEIEEKIEEVKQNMKQKQESNESAVGKSRAKYLKF